MIPGEKCHNAGVKPTPAPAYMLMDNTHFPVLYISNRHLKKGQ